jgi:hypothetical protein
MGFKKAYGSFRREALYNILREFGIPTKMIMLTKVCLNETYCRAWVGKHLSEMFRNGFKQRDVLTLLIFNCVL